MDIIKRDFLVKRAQLKSRITRETYKGRWFELTHEFLRYSDGSKVNGCGEMKGKIYLKNILAIEEANSEIFDGRKNAFQIVYCDDIEKVRNTLYVFTEFDYKRSEWISALRAECQKQKANFMSKFHPGAWSAKHNVFSCCNMKEKMAEGCQNVSLPPSNRFLNNKYETDMNVNSKIMQPVVDLHSSSENKDIATHNLAQKDNKTLPLIKGQEYLQKSDVINENLILACDQNENNGLISNTLINDSFSDLNSCIWFYSKMSRTLCEIILSNDGREGVFLVRNSSLLNYYSLSLFTKLAGIDDGSVKHYKIKKTSDGKYFLSESHTFDSLPELINYHKHNSAGLIVRLRCCPNDEKDGLPSIPLPSGIYDIDPSNLEMKEILGKGQFGTVHRALYKGTVVAVKSMIDGSMLEEDFLEEAKTMILFDHENLVRLYGICTSCKPIIIATEFMKNGSLLTYIRKRANYLSANVNILMCMCIDVCNGMRYLESKGVIHRDLAARNCLVSDLGLVKVGDFGLARKLLDNMYTCSAGAKMPVRWSAPEIIQYERYSNKSDVWSFGVLLWEIFSLGDSPYADKKNSEVMQLVCKDNYRMPVPSLCSPFTATVLLSCWSQREDDRPSFKILYDLLLPLQISSQDYE